MGLHSTVRNCLGSISYTIYTTYTIKMSMSKIKQNFHSDSEALINKQINMELYASYVYLSMSAYFARDDIALMGFSKRFRDVAKPTCDEWGTALEAIEASLELEKTVNESLLNMHKMADSHGDAQMTDYLEGTYLKEQVEAIKEIADLVTKMKRAGDGLGLHIIDKELLG